VLDAVGELLAAALIDRKGALKEGLPGVHKTDGVAAYTLASSSVTAHGRPVVITRRDINEIQLAKAAIRTGVDVLLREAGAAYGQIDEFIVAGAFGTYLDVENSVRIGMFPPLPLDRFRQVGNAAGAGARQILLSATRRRFAAQRARELEYVELTVHPDFTKMYMRALYLGEQQAKA
jgi:uncharacterized 2Fe-2S/4Fe-4S cluster protein (DUF4445 family)